MKLSQQYYFSNDTIKLSKSLLGKVLITNINNKKTSGIIVEVESYLGAEDKASHSFMNKKTNRNKPMFEKGGIAYVYLCYGIHYLFNIVVGKKNAPQAILVRSIEPLDGINLMLKRRNINLLNKNLTNGPGKLTQALGITGHINYKSLSGNEIWLENYKEKIKQKDILSTTRIGVDYAKEDAILPYRFYIKGNNWVSRL